MKGIMVIGIIVVGSLLLMVLAFCLLSMSSRQDKAAEHEHKVLSRTHLRRVK